MLPDPPEGRGQEAWPRAGPQGSTWVGEEQREGGEYEQEPFLWFQGQDRAG